jgi:hypothetical protein
MEHARAPRWGLGQVTSALVIHANQTTSWLMRNWSTFGARTNHGHTQIHKIHHGLDLGEATTFPLTIFSMPSHWGCTQMSFCPEIPIFFLNWDFCHFGGP